jgi:hypothetical protein
MTHKDDAAFSRSATYNEHTYTINSAQYGLTKREYFAAMAMQGISANGVFAGKHLKTIAEWSVNQADALIEELNKQK